MTCYYPHVGWRSRVVNQATGKRPIVFDVTKGFSDMEVTLPCGKCIGCLLERSRQWAVRCMHEASLHEENCFVTLTYDDEHLPADGSLDRRAFPLFMKRLRKAHDGKRIRYFHCGEYGSQSKRAHYHALLFGHDFSDKTHWASRGGYPVWRSASLERLWPFGNCEIGTVTFESAGYVARYVVKKMKADYWRDYAELDTQTGEVVERAREYTTMSRRPGIGVEWYERFRSEVYPADSVVVRGRLCRPPRAYDKRLEVQDAGLYRRVVKERELRVVEGENTWDRLRVRENHVKAGVNLQRGL